MWCHRIENLIAKLKHSRTLATRYDKRARHYIAFAQLAAIKIRICSQGLLTQTRNEDKRWIFAAKMGG